MSELVHLSSPEGEPFEVIPSKAGKLLSDGWHFTPTVTEPVSDPSPVPVPVEARDPVVDAEVQANSVPVEVEEDTDPVSVEEEAPKSRRR